MKIKITGIREEHKTLMLETKPGNKNVNFRKSKIQDGDWNDEEGYFVYLRR